MRSLVLAFLACSLLCGQALPPTPIPGASDFTFDIHGDPQDDVTAVTAWNTMISAEIAMMATYHPSFVVFVGDLTNYCNSTEYGLSASGMASLWATGTPVLLVAGNHDVGKPWCADANSQNAQWIAYARNFVADKPYIIAVEDNDGTSIPAADWDSYMPAGTCPTPTTCSAAGQYQRILYQLTVAGKTFLFVAFGKEDLKTTPEVNAAIAWVDGQINTWRAAHPGQPIWLIQHEWLNMDGVSNGGVDTTYWNWLRDHPYIQSSFSGHWGVTVPHWAYTRTVTTSGNILHQIQIDHQGGQGDPHVGTYAILRVKPSGRIDGCDYKTVAAAGADAWGVGWLDAQKNCATYSVGWRGMFPMPGAHVER